MADRKDEGTLTLLGNKNNEYPDDYAPQMLQTFLNKHPPLPNYMRKYRLNILTQCMNLIILNHIPWSIINMIPYFSSFKKEQKLLRKQTMNVIKLY